MRVCKLCLRAYPSLLHRPFRVQRVCQLSDQTHHQVITRPHQLALIASCHRSVSNSICRNSTEHRQSITHCTCKCTTPFRCHHNSAAMACGSYVCFEVAPSSLQSHLRSTSGPGLQSGIMGPSCWHGIVARIATSAAGGCGRRQETSSEHLLS